MQVCRLTLQINPILLIQDFVHKTQSLLEYFLPAKSDLPYLTGADVRTGACPVSSLAGIVDAGA